MPRKHSTGPGDYETRLLSLRDLLTASLEDCPPYARAPLARQLIDVLARLEELHPQEVSDSVDDLAASRARRRAAAEARRGATGEGRASRGDTALP